MNVEDRESTAVGRLTRTAKLGVFAAVLAVLVNAVLLAAGRAVLPVPAGFEPLQWRPALVSTAAGALGGAVVYAGLALVTSRAETVFVVVAAVVLLASFVPLWAVARSAPASVLGFTMLLHVTTAVVTVWVLVDVRSMLAGR